MIEDRCERASTLIASQLLVEDWHGVMGDSNQADALCDRLLAPGPQGGIELTDLSLRLTKAMPRTKA